ncbi:MAG: hypothetical protein ACXU82_16815 [Caulobacteraceae bacterium]
MSTLHPGVWLQCVGPTGPGSVLVVGANYRCVAVDDELEYCRVHPGQGCGGVMVDGACPVAGFWFCERLFKPIDHPEEHVLDAVLERAVA